MLQAFQLLVRENSRVYLKIGGEGTQQGKYKALASELGIAERVEWLGLLNRQATVEHYQTCNAFALPSLHENLPLVLLEAMACGKPLISTYCGGPESIITPETGLLVEPGSAEALMKALQQLYNNYNNYDTEAIRESFCKRYSRPVVCQQIMNVYRNAVAVGK